MRTFDYSFLEQGTLPACFVNIVSEIAVLQERINNRKDVLDDVLEKLEPIARDKSVRASGEIAGVTDEENLVGYREALALIHDDSTHPAFQENIREDDIFRLHGFLLLSNHTLGLYRQNHKKIEIKLKGNQKFQFSPITSREMSLAIEQLINAYAEAWNNPKISRLLLIPCVAFDFLCVYPFTEGNGRMSRLLSLLLLYKSGFDVGRYISFEEKICNSKEEYFAAIRECSNDWHENQNSYFPFIKHFLDTLLICYRELDKYKGKTQRGVENINQVPKNQQIRDFVLGSLIPVSKQEICDVLSDVSSTTVESVLGSMIREGVIEKVGKGRSTKYIKK